MQHIVHIFIGKELVSFRETFASIFRQNHADFEQSLFTALSLTINEDSQIIFSPDAKGDPLDKAIIDNNSQRNSLINYFEDLYSRKVTVVNPGNQSMIVMIWTMMFLDNIAEIIKFLVETIEACYSNYHIEISGFTNESVSCFIPVAEERIAPEVYKKNFDNNIEAILKFRKSLDAFRLISDRNMDNVGLGFNEDSMAFVCAAYAALICKHYLSVHHTIIDSQEYPFETFGISSILFDNQYYQKYLLNRTIIDKLEEQGVNNREFNINALASTTNPVLNDILDDVHKFYETKVANAKAILALGGNCSDSDVVGSIDKEVKEIVERLREKVDVMLSTEHISIFEIEALLTLILGEDNAMFESSAVKANETTIDDIIDESISFFVGLDEQHFLLRDISQVTIKEIRNRMRNIAVANRKRVDRLQIINNQKKESVSIQKHIHNNEYSFGDVNYKINLNIDKEPLDRKYEPHDLNEKNVDLRCKFKSIRNQGNQGSCASFAVASVIETMANTDEYYSPAFLYWNSRVRNNSTAIDSDSTLNDIIKVAIQKGDCKEEYMPYNEGVISVPPSEKAISQALQCKIIESKTVEPKLKDIKSALSDGYPVIVAVRIFDSFSETRSGFVRVPLTDEILYTDKLEGQGIHAMVVCGFSDEERVFIVRNSWGTMFGDKGYCYVPYSYAQQFFLQACIITELSVSSGSNSNSKHTINFNMGDSKIESAIIQNLVDEDEYQLHILAEEESKLKTEWTQNLVALGNTNNQAEIIKKAKDRLNETIKKEQKILSELQSSENDKIDAFKRKYLKWIFYSAALCLISWASSFYLFNHSEIFKVTLIIAIILSTCLVGLLGAFGYKWRMYRQVLRDEIQRISNIIGSYFAEQDSLWLKAHLHGTILREVEDFRSELRSRCKQIHAFNDFWIKIYEDTRIEIETMTPAVSYPFLAILENRLLDNYYIVWKSKFLSAIDFDALFKVFSQCSDFKLIIKQDKTLNRAIVRGLKDFSMKEYVKMQNNAKWQFLPDSHKISEIIPDLDYRATPFCHYNLQNSCSIEKYIFIKDISQEEMKDFLRYCSQTPLIVNDEDPYSISILNIVRYNFNKE